VFRLAAGGAPEAGLEAVIAATDAMERCSFSATIPNAKAAAKTPAPAPNAINFFSLEVICLSFR
jgi:hypothetical protein